LADSARERPEDMRFVLDAMLATNRHRLEAGATGGTGVQPVGVVGPTHQCRTGWVLGVNGA